MTRGTLKNYGVRERKLNDSKGKVAMLLTLISLHHLLLKFNLCKNLLFYRGTERAWLQAEAKAAEDARRQAEAEAAAEAKRKRELEREAARQALLKASISFCLLIFFRCSVPLYIL